MTKSEFSKLPAEDMRALLLSLFDDPEGELAGMNKKSMVSFAKDNWDDIKDHDTAVEEPKEEAEPKFNPKTSLHTGHRHKHSSHNPNTDLG